MWSSLGSVTDCQKSGKIVQDLEIGMTSRFRHNPSVLISAMKIALSYISPEGSSFTFHLKAEAFSVLKEMLVEGEVTDFSNLVIEVTLTAYPGYYDVVGKVAGQVGLACGRCLKSFRFRFDQRFNLRFSQEIPQDLNADDNADLELTADQIGMLYFRGNELDLHDAVQEQVVMALPYKPLCSDTCKGLCPKCGTDLNLGLCSCGDNGRGSPFDILQNFRPG